MVGLPVAMDAIGADRNPSMGVRETTTPIIRRDARVICTVGMHRSGTSLVMRLVNLLGVHLGPDAHVLTSGADNPMGYWEYRPFVDINDAILASFGGRWEKPPVFPAGWQHDARLDDLKARARDLIAADFAAAPVWGWKDPRSCTTLPFWQDVIGPMRYIVCVRNPASVVASLMAREKATREHAEGLWLEHMQAALAATSGRPRLFVFYEDVLANWLEELRWIAAFIGSPERAADPRVHDAAAAFVRQDMCHHSFSMADLFGDQRLSGSTVGLAFALRGYARRPAGSPGDAVKLHRADPTVDAALDAFADRALRAWNQMARVATFPVS
jgi:hypothetical protein